MSRRLVVFTGPTLPPAAARAVLSADYLPPVSQGDLYRVALEQPLAIGIIDGYFGSVPSVWHKEILWALSRGIHVFGAASMGALRAAECGRYGMVGIGRIHADFAAGRLTDDDEVAVVHGDQESGFVELSEALVNVRATLERAVAESRLSPAAAEAALALARDLHYPERTWPRILGPAGAAAGAAAAEELAALGAALPAARVNQKRLDALEMLRAMHRLIDEGAAPFSPGFPFEHTDAWENVARTSRRSEEAERGAAGVEPLLEELRLEGEAAPLSLRGALLRALAREQAQRRGLATSQALIEETAARFRRERGLLDEDALQVFLRDNDLDAASSARLIEGEALLRATEALFRGDALRSLVDELRASGRYPAVRARAARKQSLLASLGLAEPALADTGLDEAGLLAWYFEERLGLPRPPPLELHLRRAGLDDQQELLRQAAREYLYLRWAGGHGS